MFGSSGDGGRPSMVLTTLKSAAAIAVLSFVAANWLSSSTLDRNGLSHLAQTASRGIDPVTTGSIGSKAAATRLDPCALPTR